VGVEAAVAATALGSVCIEKHFTLSHDLEGPDHKASAEPDELRQLVAAVTAVKTALGDGVKRPMPSEMANLPLIRRSLVAVGALKKGQALTREMVEIKRPADGIDPRRLDEALGRTLARDLVDDEPITWDSLA
jgi:sialic acid synthase SpsE